MTLKSLSNAVVPGVITLGVFALIIRFGGDLPVLKDVKEGMKGNVSGKLFS